MITLSHSSSQRLLSALGLTNSEENTIEYITITEEYANTSVSEMSEKEFGVRVSSTPALNANKVCEPFLRRVAEARGFCKNVSREFIHVDQNLPVQVPEHSTLNTPEMESGQQTKFNFRYTKLRGLGEHNIKFVQKKRLLISKHRLIGNKWIYFRREFKDNELNMTKPNERNNDERVKMDKFHTPSGTPHRNELVIKWCPIFKAASTTWMAIFAQLSGALTVRTETLIRHNKMNFLTLNKDFRLNIPKTTALSQTYSMVIVRHPFDRILSAYRDKIERTVGREFYIKKYSARIINKFRRSPYLMKRLTETNKTIVKNRSVSEIIRQDSLSKSLSNIRQHLFAYLTIKLVYTDTDIEPLSTIL